MPIKKNKTRNPYATVVRKFRPQKVKPKKGKGSYDRRKECL